MTAPATPSFKDHFSTKAGAYAAYRPTYPAALVAYLAAAAPGHGLVLDCGCGAGQLSGLLATGFTQVVATDASAAQIANAPRLPGVRFAVAPAEASGLDDGSADAVTVAQAAHWFDLNAFYGEVRRILRPGGILALITYGIIETDGPAGAIIDDFYHRILDGYWPPERRHVETGYRELPFPFQELTPPALAMTAEWDRSQTIGYIDTWSAVRQLEKAEGRAPFDAFADRLAAAWPDPQTLATIRWPLSLRVGRV